MKRTALPTGSAWVGQRELDAGLFGIEKSIGKCPEAKLKFDSGISAETRERVRVPFA